MIAMLSAVKRCPVKHLHATFCVNYCDRNMRRACQNSHAFDDLTKYLPDQHNTYGTSFLLLHHYYIIAFLYVSPHCFASCRIVVQLQSTQQFQEALILFSIMRNIIICFDQRIIKNMW